MRNYIHTSSGLKSNRNLKLFKSFNMVETLTENKSEILTILFKSLVKVWPKNVSWGIENNFNPNGRLVSTHDWNIGGRTFINLDDFIKSGFEFNNEKVRAAFDKKKTYLNQYSDPWFEFGFEVAYFDENNKYHKGYFNRMWVKFGTLLLEDEEYYDTTNDWQENFNTFSEKLLTFY